MTENRDELIAYLMVRIDALEAIIIEDRAQQLGEHSATVANSKLMSTHDYVTTWRTDTAEQTVRRRKVGVAVALLLEHIGKRANFLRFIRDGAPSADIAAKLEKPDA